MGDNSDPNDSDAQEGSTTKISINDINNKIGEVKDHALGAQIVGDQQNVGPQENVKEKMQKKGSCKDDREDEIKGKYGLSDLTLTVSRLGS